MRALLATTCTPDDRKALASARGLREAGWEPWVSGDRFLGQAFWSRSVARRVRSLHPKDGVQNYVEDLARQLKNDPPDALLPLNDYTTIAFAQGRETLEQVAPVMAPPLAGLEIASDKHRTGLLAREVGLETPATWLVSGPEGLKEVARSFSGPYAGRYVLKLRRGSGSVGMGTSSSVAELAKFMRPGGSASDLAFNRSEWVVQEHIEGELHEVNALFRHGRPLAALTQRRLRMFPNTGGPGVWSETTREPDLIERAVALLRRLSWHGPAQVEFLIESSTGRPKLIEINGRFWGTLNLAIAAGMNFPALAARMTAGEDVKPQFDYREGVGFRWPLPFALLRTLEAADRWGELRGWLAGSAESDLWWSDPAPILAETAYGVGRLLSGARPGQTR